jgi:hypothetical protein
LEPGQAVTAIGIGEKSNAAEIAGECQNAVEGMNTASRRLALLSLGACITALLVAPIGGGGAASEAANCGKWEVRARIDGRSVCLREGRSCKASLRRQYDRYGFVCQFGTLDVRWKYLRARPLDSLTVLPGTRVQ